MDRHVAAVQQNLRTWICPELPFRHSPQKTATTPRWPAACSTTAATGTAFLPSRLVTASRRSTGTPSATLAAIRSAWPSPDEHGNTPASSAATAGPAGRKGSRACPRGRGHHLRSRGAGAGGTPCTTARAVVHDTHHRCTCANRAGPRAVDRAASPQAADPSSPLTQRKKPRSAASHDNSPISPGSSRVVMVTAASCLPRMAAVPGPMARRDRPGRRVDAGPVPAPRRGCNCRGQRRCSGCRSEPRR